MNKEIGKQLIKTYKLVLIFNCIQQLSDEDEQEYNDECNMILLDIIIEMKNDYYSNKTVMLNNQVLKIKPSTSRNNVHVMINNTSFSSPITEVDKYIIYE